MDNTLLPNSSMPSMGVAPARAIISPKQILRVVAVLIIIAAAGYFVVKTPKSLAASGPDGKGYQAVFLNNNQVYFGKLTGTGSQWLRLTDVYYLQENQPAIPARKGEPQPRFTLLKLGRQELHGPTDLMVFNRSNVLLWENLKSDSEVVKKINEDKDQQKQK